MTNPNTPATTGQPSAGEGGLGSYLEFWNSIVAGCEQGANTVESTLADMTGNDWSGQPVDSGLQVQELLANAREAAAAVVAALESSLAVADSYAANSHTGTKESVTAL